jgi:hypothetical protein
MGNTPPCGETSVSGYDVFVLRFQKPFADRSKVVAATILYISLQL